MCVRARARRNSTVLLILLENNILLHDDSNSYDAKLLCPTELPEASSAARNTSAPDAPRPSVRTRVHCLPTVDMTIFFPFLCVAETGMGWFPLVSSSRV